MSETSTPSAKSGVDDLEQTAKEVKERALQEGAALKEKARAGLDDAKAEAVQQSEAAKNRAASEMSQTSQALRTAAGELDDGSIQHKMFTQAADAVGSMAEALSDRSVGEIVDQLSRFGRRNPAALIGGAVLAGLVVSRFLRASERNGSGAETAATRTPYEPSRVQPPAMPAAGARSPDQTSFPSEKGPTHG